MNMSIPVLSTWAVGILNGYKKNEGLLPRSIPYTTMSLATVLTSFKVMTSISQLKYPISPHPNFGSVMCVTALGIGSIYCMGNQVGKALAK
jgi:hypothetical protein